MKAVFPKKLWPGKERRKPNFSNPCWYTLHRISSEIQNFSKKIKRGGKLMDFGCGNMPYYPYFKKCKLSEYFGIDISDSPEKEKIKNKLTIKEGDRLPFKDGYFDAVISTQVFEHIRNPILYLEEIRRTTKKNGLIFISSAFSWDYHPYPKDFWRITKDGYEELCRNYTEMEFKYDTNSIQTILQSANLLMARKGIKSKLPYWIINLIINKFDYAKGDHNFPSNIFVFLKK